MIEHDPGVAELERLYLTREGFDVRVETDPARVPMAVAAFQPDVVVLDLSAPGASDLHRRVADLARPAPVVCVVAAGTGPHPAGSLTRPFGPRLLVAAVGEALRARNADGGSALRVGLVVLEPSTRSVTVAGRPVALTATEFDLLAFLMAGPGRVFTREQLLDAAWGAVTGVGARTIDVHIAQLRSKLGEGSPIRTVRGVGYAAG